MPTDGSEPIEVRPGSDGWEVVRRGETKRSIYPTQLDAERSGREIARREHAEFVLLDDDGRIRAVSTYGKDLQREVRWKPAPRSSPTVA
jgi:hypothetical protein